MKTGGDDDEVRRRRRRTEDMRRLRSRIRRKVQLFDIEVDGFTYDMAIKFGGLKESQVDNKPKVTVALGKVLRKGLISLLENSAKKV